MIFRSIQIWKRVPKHTLIKQRSKAVGDAAKALSKWWNCQNKHMFLYISLRECWWERTADEPKGCHWPKSLQCSLVRWFIYMIIDGQYSYLSRCADGRWQLRSQKALSLSKKPPMLISQMVYIYDNRWGISMHVLIILTRIDLHVLIILTRIDHLRSCHSNVSEAEIRQLHVQTC